MTREQYLAQRKALMDEAQAAIDSEDLDTFNAKKEAVDALEEKYENFAKAQANMNAMKDNQPVLAAAIVKEGNEEKVMDKSNEVKDQKHVEAEARGKTLKANNAVTVGSSNIVLPKHTGSNINDGFNQVSSLIDRVDYEDLPGGESYTEPYEIAHGTGDYTTEGGAAAAAEPTFGYSQMNKAKVTAYSEHSEEVEKLPNANYAQKIIDGVSKATRRKITREILLGTGAANSLVGIFSTAVTTAHTTPGPIDASKDLALEKITNDTLDDIIFTYGGDEDVEDAAVLLLNKKDLKAFAQLRTADGKKFHDIKTDGNTGTIDGIPFIINSACKAISDAATTDGQFGMAYGPLSSYKLAVFSDLEVKRSDDVKFREGMIAHRGVTFIAGNVVRYNGFLRIKKKVVAG